MPMLLERRKAMRSLIEEAVDEAVLFFWTAVKTFGWEFSSALREIRQWMARYRPTLLLVSDHLVLGGLAERTLRCAGYNVVARNKSDDATDSLTDQRIDLVVIYLSLGAENNHEKNQALPFARWLAEQDGQYPPVIILMRGYEERNPRFRVIPLEFFPFQGGQGEDWEASLPTIRRNALPLLVAWWLTHTGVR